MSFDMINVSYNKIKSLVSIQESIDVIAKGYSDLSKGIVSAPLRTKIETDNNSTILIMPAYRSKGRYFVTKIVSVNNSTSNKSQMISAHIKVFCANTGKKIAILNGDIITSMRTGAASGIATKILSNKSVDTLAIFGTGVQANSQIEYITHVRSIKRIFVYGRDLISSKKFAKNISKNLNIDVNIGTNDDLSKVDIISTVTPSRNPLFDHENLKPGVHINAIGSFKPSMVEIPIETIISSNVFVDSIGACKDEAGDLINASENSDWTFNDVCCEIGDIINKTETYKQNSKKITLFKSVGIGIQDLVMSELILDKLGN
tara:strand:+ start:633 stop:1583 length:951 start_codon:yes stop_codon:yes gene_type:complete